MLMVVAFFISEAESFPPGPTRYTLVEVLGMASRYFLIIWLEMPSLAAIYRRPLFRGASRSPEL